MLKADEMETRGDAAGSLRVIESMPLGPDGRPFWRPERIRRLEQLVALGDSAPAWVWARWVVAQAAQCTPGDPKRAFALAVRVRGGQHTLWGTDELDAELKVIDHDWVYRQLVLHEYGGLAAFLRRRASRTLLSRAQGVEAWVDAPMGAYQLLDEAPDEITWRDLGSGRLVTTVNLASAAFCTTGEHVMGRVVESAGARLFESPPLWVPPAVAEAVAASPPDWVSAVEEGCRGPFGPVLAEVVAKVHRFDLLCDLPLDLRRHLLQPDNAALRADQVASGGNGREYDVTLVLSALAGRLDVEGEADCSCDRCAEEDRRPAAALVAAALLEPGTADALESLLVPSDATALRWLGDVLAPPAGMLCERLAARLSGAA